MIAAPVRCVVDASVAIKLVVQEPLANEAHTLFAHLTADPQAAFHVPELFYLECGNILWKYVQRAGYPPADAARGMQTLLALALRRLSVVDLAADALDLALAHQLTTYDACYVAAARRLALPLVTADQKLVHQLAGTPHVAHWLGNVTLPSSPTP